MKILNDGFIRQNYASYDNRVIEFLSKIYMDVVNQNEHISNYNYCMIDLLAVQLQIYYTSCDQLLKLTDLTTVDSYNRAAKSPVISVLNKAHANIIDIMQKLSLSNIELAKLRRLNNNDDAESAEELLKDLVG